VLKWIITLLHAYLWVVTKVTGGKCKVNCETLWWPTKLVELGIMHLEKFASALRLR
jgi:hypothetical protein